MASATLTINLPAIAHNYKLLSARLASGRSGAAVKANAYGLGVAAVAPALAKAGCNDFFVATLEEGIQMSDIRCQMSGNADFRIYVINGITRGEEKEFAVRGLIPVLNTPEQLKLWARFAAAKTTSTSDIRHLTSVLQIDTGMNRLGLSAAQLEALDKNLLKKARVNMVMSHLACADEQDHPMNTMQLERFKDARRIPAFAGMTKGAGMTEVEWSLANSSGIFLGKNYHLDLARPGCALYGINPTPHRKNPMRAVAELTAPILQIREITQKETVGYGATYMVKKGSRVATLGIGYADGFFRHLGGKAYGFIGNVRVPMVGRVSMDMATVDVTQVPENILNKNPRVEFIGPNQSVDEFATIAGTIGYEVFTRLGSRVKRYT